jgi:hypothetical protein
MKTQSRGYCFEKADIALAIRERQTAKQNKGILGAQSILEAADIGLLN